MPGRSYSFVTFAGVMILAISSSSDNPASPGTPSQLDNASPPPASRVPLPAFIAS
jgi:hypothetical protein